LYYRIPTEAELLDEPYTQQDFIDAQEHVDTWEENWDVLMLFTKYMRQWRMGFNGPVALDFQIFFHELDRKEVPADLYDEYIDKLAVIENAALIQIHKKH
jgi:hypothetical protein